MPTDVTDSPSDQSRLVASLVDPGRFGKGCTRVTHLETHISHVLLTGAFAYKIKKPLDLGFLDFTTLAKRRYYCEEELRLNRRLAPDIYLDVVAITGSLEDPVLNGAGTTLEYAVRMREFAQEALASRMLAQGTLSAAHIDALAAEVAAFHGRIDVAPPGSAFGTPDTVLDVAAQNFEQIRPLLTDSTDHATLDALRDWTLAEHTACRGALQQRHDTGFVRECHGDLHLNNIAILAGAVTIFDCIEFNDELRWIDVMSEVAFTVMDLEDRGRGEFGHRFLNAYLERTGDYAGLAVLRFYLAYRAMVRAKVACLRGGQLAPGDAKTALVAEYRSYVDLARHYARPPQPAFVVTHGLSGCGKTTLTQPLLELCGAIRIRTDVERKRLHGIDAAARSGSALDAGLYTADATERTYRRVLALAEAVAAAGSHRDRRRHVSEALAARSVSRARRGARDSVRNDRLRRDRGDAARQDRGARLARQRRVGSRPRGARGPDAHTGSDLRGRASQRVGLRRRGAARSRVRSGSVASGPRPAWRQSNRGDMNHFDVFNGDADGLCALHQLRLEQPLDSVLVTGVKRDIALLQRVAAAPGDTITALDISLDTNRAALIALLERGVSVEYFDHHYAGVVPAHPKLTVHIDTAPGVCTGMIVDRHLGGRRRIWAVVAAYGDNLGAAAAQLALSLGLDATHLEALRDLGETLAYNAYGETEADLVVAPAELYRLLRPYADPFAFMRDERVFREMSEARRADLVLANAIEPEVVLAGASVYVLPDAPWSRRVQGVFANELARARPRQAHAVLTPTTVGTYTVSVRAPLATRTGADTLCRQFATGGGRAAAAGINQLPHDDLPRFVQALEAAYP